MSNLDELKAKLPQILKIVEKCPELLQPECLKLLLGEYLKTRSPWAPRTVGRDLEPNRIHPKARRFFFDKYSVGMEMLNWLFYEEGDGAVAFHDLDLETTAKATCQIRLALLESVRQAIATGEFAFEVEIVRRECETRDCYDSANFQKNFRNKKQLFVGYDSTCKKLPLSDKGKEDAIEVIKLLAPTPETE